MLVGTDYNVGGIKGIGPKKALALLQEHKGNPENIFEAAKWNDNISTPWTTIFDLFKNVDVNNDTNLNWKPVDRDKVIQILCEEHEFSKERIEKALDEMNTTTKAQKGLGEFF
jgi:flap endonuclease-1